MPYDERWLTDVLAKGQVRVVGEREPVAVPAISEKAFMAAILRVAREHGWMAYHTFDSRRSPSGFPDLVLVRPPVCLFIECKTSDGMVRLAQQHWLDVLGQVTRVEAHCWRPNDWPLIQATLGG